MTAPRSKAVEIIRLHEAFKEALSRVSRRVAVLARQAAQKLRAERLGR